MLPRDLRYAIRMILRDPGFSAVVVISVALGIAANTTVFSMVNAIVLGALPVRDPGGLYSISGGRTFPYPNYREFRDECAGAFSGLAAHFPLTPANLAGSGPAERVWGQLSPAITSQWLRRRSRWGAASIPTRMRRRGRARWWCSATHSGGAGSAATRM